MYSVQVEVGEKEKQKLKEWSGKNRTGAIYYFGSFAVCIFAELHAKMLTK